MQSKEKIRGVQLIMGYWGFIIMLSGFITLLPLLVLFAYPEEFTHAKCFYIPGIIAIFVGYALTLLIRGKGKGIFRQHQEAVILLGAWFFAILIAALPFMISGNYNLAQSVFESTSGFTTTGMTIVNPDSTPKLFLMHRSLTMFFGGVGLMLVLMSVLSDSMGMRLYNAEGHKDRLLPNLIRSARLLFSIYSGYIIAGMLIYRGLGMSWFDSLNHSISVYATGGFSTRSGGIGSYNSLPIEIATMVFMLLGAVNFVMHLYLLRGKFKTFMSHCENKFTVFLIALFVPLIAFISVNSIYNTFSESFRFAFFNVIATFTTTGISAGAPLSAYAAPVIFLMILLMFIGGSSESTAGAIKQYRVWVALKALWWDLRDRFSNKRVVRANLINRFGKIEALTPQETRGTLAFIMWYVGIALIGTFIFMLFGNPLQNSLFEFASALGNVGFSTGITNYYAHPIILWTGTIGMFIGRLEIMIVFMGLGSIISSVKRRLD
ncbi:MAG: TrkH family potassium uptake protein [Clostridiales bacterium]|nr:TrkH family potassium uptake protein [Clostridiales bacterium]